MNRYRVTVAERIIEKITVEVFAESQEAAEEEAIRKACEEVVERNFSHVEDRWADEVEPLPNT